MYSTILADLIARMDYHSADVSGRILRGVKWVKTPVIEGEALTDLPTARLFIPNIKESYKPAKQIFGTIEIMLLVASAREKGVVVNLQWVEKVMDSLQLNTSGVVAALAGTIKPFDWRTEGNFTVDGSLNAQVIISATPAVRGIAQRRA
jgi:hypothetical protein